MITQELYRVTKEKYSTEDVVSHMMVTTDIVYNMMSMGKWP